jgi:glucose/mannose-6-phosphate isomerase
MIDLNDKATIANIDRKDVYTSVKKLANQCRQTWNEIKKINFPQDYKNVQNIVLCGMGGSAYAAYFIKGLFGNSLPVPFELVNGDTLPTYVNESTLVMLSSYSGSTDETMSCAQQALERKAKITAVTAGSKLGDFIRKNNFPAYIFNPLYNPAGQPRLGQGYMIMGHIGILAKINLINFSDSQAYNAIDFIEQNNNSIEQNAKEIVREFVEKIPVIVASSHLAGNAHILRNQFNETAKNFSTYSLIPELNHHLMEGLLHPKERILKFLFLHSSSYSPAIKKRFELTKDVVAKNNINAISIDILGDTLFAQTLYALSFGGYTTFYLAILYNQDPSVIPWVDYFKDKLSKG